MPLVFISHSSLDREVVERHIIAPLREYGIEIWYSQDAIETANEWQEKIVEGLEKCDWFLVAMTPRSTMSSWVKREVAWAIEMREGRFIPVLLETCDRVKLNLALYTMQYIDFREDVALAQDKLLATWRVGQEAEQRTAIVLKQAGLLAAQEDWSRAIEELEDFLELYPKETGAVTLLADIRKRQSLDEEYCKGNEYLQEGDWQKALESFEKVVSREADYKDVNRLIKSAHLGLERRAISDLYVQAAQATDDERWDLVQRKLIKILSIDPAQDKAQQWLARAERELEIYALYDKGLRLYRSGDLKQALESFQLVLGKKSHFKDVISLVKEIEAKELKAIEALQLQRQRAAEESRRLLIDARKTNTREGWIAIIQQVQRLRIAFPKVDRIDAAHALAEHELLGLEQSQRIEKLYQDGESAHKGGQLQKAWVCFNQILDSVGPHKRVDEQLVHIEIRLLKRYTTRLLLLSAGVMILVALGIANSPLSLNNLFSLPLSISLRLQFLAGVIGTFFTLYHLYKLLRDSENWFWEFQFCRAVLKRISNVAKSSAQEKTGPDGDHSAVSPASVDFVSPQERLSARIKSLSKLDSTHRIDDDYITCGEYMLFIEEMSAQGKFCNPDHWQEWRPPEGKAQRAISGVRYGDAVEFCRWLTNKAGKDFLFRLPSSREAASCVTNGLPMAAWCSDRGEAALRGLPAPDRRNIKAQIKSLGNSGMPLPSRLRDGLLATHSGFTEALNSIPQGLSEYLVIPYYLANNLTAELKNAVKLKFDSQAAHASFVDLAGAVNLRYAARLIGTNARSVLLFGDDSLRKDNTALAKERIKTLEVDSVEEFPRVARLMSCLLDVAEATTIVSHRHAQRAYVLQVLEYVYAGYFKLRRSKGSVIRAKDTRRKLARLLLPNKELSRESRRIKTHQHSVLEFYWWTRIITAREMDEIPAWESIRLVKESSIAVKT
jgi:tetratricopeptide (TPR) repeat protein